LISLYTQSLYRDWDVETKPKIAIATPTNRGFKPQTVLSLLNMVASHTDVAFHFVCATEGFTIAENRHYCVAKAQKEECSHILFIDDDMTFPKDTLTRLREHEKAVVGVLSYSRKLPLTPTVAALGKEGEPRLLEGTPEELFTCYSVGFGVILIDMKVFEKLPRPFFKFEVTNIGKVYIGEDEYFCNQARLNGINIYCDPTLSIGHVGDYTYGGI